MDSKESNASVEEAGLAVLPAPAERREPRKAPPKAKEAPNFHVVIWNDDDHSPEYVIEMLMKICNHAAAQAYDITWRIHNQGKGIACTCHQELAELRREQISNYGPDTDVQGARQVSMRATLEEAP